VSGILVSSVCTVIVSGILVSSVCTVIVSGILVVLDVQFITKPNKRLLAFYVTFVSAIKCTMIAE